MARAWRIEYEGALYHVLSRGNQSQDIVVTDEDRIELIDAFLAGARMPMVTSVL